MLGSSGNEQWSSYSVAVVYSDSLPVDESFKYSKVHDSRSSVQTIVADLL